MMNTTKMEEFMRKSKRRPASTFKQYPANQPALKPIPRAAVHPSVVVRRAQDHHPEGVGATTIPNDDAAAPEQRPTRAPRKRFRKKVTGLFGDQSDLQKRMQKLLRPLSQDILVKKRKNHASDTTPPPTNIELDQIRCDKPLPPTTPAMKKKNNNNANNNNIYVNLNSNNNSMKIKINTPSGGSTMSPKALASIAKWKKFSDRIGRMSPRSNELFLNEVEVCTPMTLEHRSKDRLDPPTLPPLRNTPSTTTSPTSEYTEHEDEGYCRVGAPAMLRRKVRRNDRGYRGVDVIRIRSSSAAHDGGGGNNSNNNNGGLDVYVRSLGGMARRARSEMKDNNNMADNNNNIMPNGIVMARRARSEMTSADGRRSAPKRRRVSDETSSEDTTTDGYQYDALSLLIEAAEKEGVRSNSNNINNKAIEGGVSPLRKAKRLRSCGNMSTTTTPERSDGQDRVLRSSTIRRHTTLGVDNNTNSNNNNIIKDTRNSDRDIVHATAAHRLDTTTHIITRRRKRPVKEPDGAATEDED